MSVHKISTCIHKKNAMLSCYIAGILTFLCVCVQVSDCIASYISMEIRAGTTIKEEVITVSISAINKGDESARFVTASVTLHNKLYWGETIDNLATGGVYYTKITIPASLDAGIHTAIIRLHYSDANCYPFTALSVVPVVTEAPATINELIGITTSPIILKQQSVCNVIITPSPETTRPLPVTVKLVTPSEIPCEQPVIKLTLLPHESKTIQFRIKNISALPGSNYGILVIADYNWKGQHRSSVATSVVKITTPFFYDKRFKHIGVVLLIVTFLVFILLQLFPRIKLYSKIIKFVVTFSDLIVVAVAVIFILLQIRPDLILLDTTTTGGDTPAHNYLASHLQKHIAGGKIVSWSNGWWCGFPMFQFYFCLPYLLVVLLNTFLPFNIAFKIVTVLGILTLPITAYISARLFRLPSPAPAFAACATLLFLFDNTHTMWGGNIYSTLAGMIANSIAFSLMQVAVASLWRDYTDNRFRIVTVFMLAVLPIAHFFTTVMTIICVVIFPLIKTNGKSFFQRCWVLICEGCIAVLLASWWVIPLIAKNKYSMDFGYNWDISLQSYALSKIHPYLAIFVLVGIGISLVGIIFPSSFKNHRAVAMAHRIYPFSILNFWMLLSVSFLFMFGYEHISHVFVNVRLLPFISYSALALAVAGYSIIISICNFRMLTAVPVLIITILGVLNSAYGVRLWATWNYAGIENRPLWNVFEELVIPLHNTKGRLANDLHEANNFAFGSTRFFECVPHMVSKPILEGGIVNSAAGSMFSYYIQGETSDSCAGFPNIMLPTTFNITNATKHLELFNVKHFIARSERTKRELHRLADWRLLRNVQAWSLYELETHDGSYVFIPDYFPIAVETLPTKDRLKENALWWLYASEALQYPFLFLMNKNESQSLSNEILITSEASYRQTLHSLKKGNTQIREWLLLGPFNAPCSYKEPLEYTPIPENNLSPIEGDKMAGYIWKLCAFENPVFPSDFWRRKKGTEKKSNLITYGFVNIYSTYTTNAIINLFTDSPIKIWFNEKLVPQSQIFSEQLSSFPVELQKGRNRLLIKIYQRNENSYFDIKISSPDDTPLKNIVFSTAPVCPSSLEHRLIPENKKQIIQEFITDTKISFRTKAIGLPHIIKCIWYPNWKVKGASRVYMVSPFFMLVYPEKEDVELYYGSTTSDYAGKVLTLIGAVTCIAIASKSIAKKISKRN